MEKIRILHCMDAIGEGDPELVRYNLSGYLCKERFSQKIVCTNTCGLLPDRLEQDGTEVINIGRLGSPFHIYRFQMVLKVIRSYKPHIMHVADFKPQKMTMMAGKISRVPVIIVDKSPDLTRFSPQADAAGIAQRYQDLCKRKGIL